MQAWKEQFTFGQHTELFQTPPRKHKPRAFNSARYQRFSQRRYSFHINKLMTPQPKLEQAGQFIKKEEKAEPTNDSLIQVSQLQTPKKSQIRKVITSCYVTKGRFSKRVYILRIQTLKKRKNILETPVKANRVLNF